MFSQMFADWWDRPFDPQGSVLNWALFVLLLLLLIGIWQSVLRYLPRAAAEAISP